MHQRLSQIYRLRNKTRERKHFVVFSSYFYSFYTRCLISVKPQLKEKKEEEEKREIQAGIGESTKTCNTLETQRVN